jgi:hypothetical protein
VENKSKRCGYWYLKREDIYCGGDKMMRKSLIFLIFILQSLLFGEDKREYPCYLMSEKPILDGKEEKAWENIPEATGFFILGGQKYALEKQTYFKCGWRDEGIYIFVKCEEPAPDRITASLKDGDELFREDSVEFFFFPKDAPNYLHFVVNAIGSRWNEVGSTLQPSFPWNWQAKAFIGKDFWSVELAIPFDVLGMKPKDGEKWLINVARNINTGPAIEHFTCWPPLRGSFHEVQNFAFITFNWREISVEERKEIEEKLNAPFYGFLKGKVDSLWEELKKNAPNYEDAISYGLRSERLKGEATYIKEAWDKLQNLVEKKSPTLHELRSFISKHPDMLQRLKEFNYKVLIEKLFES